MKQTTNIHISQKLRITPGLRRSLDILSAPSGALGKMLEDYSANPLIDIIPPARTYRANGYDNPLVYARNMETTSLDMHLIQQINLLKYKGADKKALYLIVSLLDANGFFNTPVVSFARQAGLSVEKAQALLHVFKTLDPPGIGSRDYKECLMLQLKAKGLLSKNAALIIRKYLTELARENFVYIESATGVRQAYSKKLLAHIRKLRPYPAKSFNPPQPVVYIEPDIIVEAHGDRLNASLNPDTVYKVNVRESDYRAMSRGLSAADFQYLSHMLRDARWLKHAMQKRYDTLLMIANKICELQRNYFLFGSRFMTPLTKSGLAAMLGVHPSTVTRALSEKYFKSVQGVQPASFFFSGRAQFSNKYSPVQIKQYIRQMVAEENDLFPESDEKITACLNAAGIDISRRTVAKYRLDIGISPAHIRKKQR